MASHNRKLRDYDLEIDEEALAKLIAPVDDLERALDRLECGMRGVGGSYYHSLKEHGM